MRGKDRLGPIKWTPIVLEQANQVGQAGSPIWVQKHHLICALSPHPTCSLFQFTLKSLHKYAPLILQSFPNIISLASFKFSNCSSWSPTTITIKAKLPTTNIINPMAIQEIFKQCSSFGKKCSCDQDGHPNDVPKGHCVVYVGENRSRYIIPITWLNHPKFKNLLEKAAEEYGYKHDLGIILPCDERVFRQLTSWLIWSEYF